MHAASGPWWGWHQLAEVEAGRLVRDAGIRRGDLVLDVGAGHGALTEPLLRAGARVIAIELHPARASALRARFADDGVTVVRCDAADLRLPRQPFRVVANPPFGIATALMRRLLAPGSRLQRADLLLPASIAARWASHRAPAVGRWGELYDVSVGRQLPRRAFTPPVGTAVVVLTIERRGLRAIRSSRSSGAPRLAGRASRP